MTTERKAITVYLEPKVYEVLKQCADNEGRRVSQLASFVIAENIGQFMGAPARGRLQADPVDKLLKLATRIHRGPKRSKPK
jgi:hypothetical protein